MRAEMRRIRRVSPIVMRFIAMVMAIVVVVIVPGTFAGKVVRRLPVTAEVIRSGVHVDVDRLHPVDLVQERVTDLFGDGVGLGQRHLSGHLDIECHPQRPAGPSCPHVVHALDTGNGGAERVDSVDQHRVGLVERPAKDGAGRCDENGDDYHSDREAGDAVGPGPSEGSAKESRERGDRDESVLSRMMSIGDQ
jgi:hypothetical protein